MENIFCPQGNQELVERIEKLTPKSRPLWGKMNVGQMVLHCQKPLDVAEGNLRIRRGLIGLLFGKMAKKSFLDGTIKKNLPTASQFVITDSPEFATEWQVLLSLVKKFGSKGPNVIATKTHPLFGKMTDDEWGVLQYKHLDHHLKQFDV